MNNKCYIPIILGTGRQGRRSEKVADYVFRIAAKADLFTTEIIDIRNLISGVTKPPEENDILTDKWRKIVIRSSGLLVVSPEYNHSFPGELKILFDRLFQEYKGKPAGICAVANGYFGGARMVEHLQNYLLVLNMRPILPAIYFPNVEKLFSTNGEITDQTYDKKVIGYISKIAEISTNGRIV